MFIYIIFELKKMWCQFRYLVNLFMCISFIKSSKTIKQPLDRTESYDELRQSTENPLTNLFTYPNEKILNFPLDITNQYQQSQCKDSLICMPKCCPSDHLMDLDDSNNLKCSESSLFNTSDWVPNFDFYKTFIIVSGFPIWEFSHEDFENITCRSYTEEEFEIKETGDIYHFVLKQRFSRESYCIDKVHRNGSITTESRICHKSRRTKFYYNQTVTKIIIWIPISITFILLLLILFVHLITPFNMDLQKKCTLSACVSLLFGFSMIVLTPVISTISESACISLGVLVYFFFISFHFWFNVMCYEISRIIRGTFRLKRLAEMKFTLRRYFAYCAYAWGCPLLISGFVIAMQLTPLEEFPAIIRPYVVKPNISKGYCWLENSISFYLYYVVIEVFLHIMNALLMFQAALLLYNDNVKFLFCVQKNRGNPTTLRSHSSSNHIHTFKLHFKMFIVYLVILILKAIAPSLTGKQFLRTMIVILLLHGVFLFLILIQASKNTILAKCCSKALKRKSKSFEMTISSQKIIGSSCTEITRL
ncbi:UNVERIFIED_CONTAM: hypothetical protein RMT77_008799 [Armadillidium vulgare]